jgi:hypothetical protein
VLPIHEVFRTILCWSIKDAWYEEGHEPSSVEYVMCSAWVCHLRLTSSAQKRAACDGDVQGMRGRATLVAKHKRACAVDLEPHNWQEAPWLSSGRR